MTLGGGTSVMSQPEHRSKHMPTVTGEGDLYKSGGEKKSQLSPAAGRVLEGPLQSPPNWGLVFLKLNSPKTPLAQGLSGPGF